jgi:hypothetical protein
LRKDVIFHVKPEQNVDLPLRGSLGLGALLPGTSEMRNMQRRWGRTLAWNLARNLPWRLSGRGRNSNEQYNCGCPHAR